MVDESIIDESKLCSIDDCMFYLHKSLSSYLLNYNITFDLIELEYVGWFFIRYYTRLSVNSKIFYFNFIESLNDDGEPYNLVYYDDIVEYVGGSAIFDRIIYVLTPDLIIHEMNEIDNEIKDLEKSIEKHLFEISTMTSLSSNTFEYKLPLDIVLKLI